MQVPLYRFKKVGWGELWQRKLLAEEGRVCSKRKRLVGLGLERGDYWWFAAAAPHWGVHCRQICNGFQDVLSTSADLLQTWPCYNCCAKSQKSWAIHKTLTAPVFSCLCDLHCITADICKVVILSNDQLCLSYFLLIYVNVSDIDLCFCSAVSSRMGWRQQISWSST